jgi:hypothetical protein
MVARLPTNSPYRLRQQEVMAAYGRFALQTHDVDALLQEATQHCSDGLQTKFAKVMVFLPDEGNFCCAPGSAGSPALSVTHERGRMWKARPVTLFRPAHRSYPII